ncbi:MAG: DHH family phosphoesterase [Archaeoglobaceae archaeon]|nr:DHH family phosphoesterase [Archaeoglobaceae archaeon]MDW8127740.1 DHH family phosphoesterase [Archaeoglobaceae archaeon]
MTNSVLTLKDLAKKAVNLLSKHNFARIYTHYDADGISAGAIIAKALLRAQKDFQITFLKGLNDFEPGDEELQIFLDMGSGYSEVMSKIDADLIILDHHKPNGEIKPKRGLVHVNPHLVGVDGTYEISASGIAYITAKELGNNSDLATMAILGIIGDKQKFLSFNGEILNEAVSFGYAEVKPGIYLPSGNLSKALKMSLEPYLDFYDKEEELNEFLSRIGLNWEKEVDELNLEEVQKLADAIVLRLLKMGAYEGVFEQIIGKKVILKNLPIKNAINFVDLINSCGRAGEASTAFRILLGDEEALARGLQINEKHITEILEDLSRRKKEVRESFCIRYLVIDDAPATSPIATILSRYLMPDKPIIVLNIKKDGKVKVSARTTDKIAQKLDLAEIMRLSALRVNGVGGGHRVAAGANIEKEKIEEFLKEVDRLCCAMLA